MRRTARRLDQRGLQRTRCLAFGLIAGLMSDGKNAKKFMLIAARPSVIAWLFSVKMALAQFGGVNE